MSLFCNIGLDNDQVESGVLIDSFVCRRSEYMNMVDVGYLCLCDMNVEY